MGSIERRIEELEVRCGVGTAQFTPHHRRRTAASDEGGIETSIERRASCPERSDGVASAASKHERCWVFSG